MFCICNTHWGEDKTAIIPIKYIKDMHVQHEQYTLCWEKIFITLTIKFVRNTHAVY